MSRSVRDRRLTPEEAAKYNRVREQVATELPELVQRHHERMSMKESQELIIGKSGEIRGIYSPEVNKITSALGTPEKKRASHVEPNEELRNEAIDWLIKNRPELVREVPTVGVIGPADSVRRWRATHYLPIGWWADLLPVGGPVLGPFEDRDPALAAEVAWLRDNNIPFEPADMKPAEEHPSPPPTAAGQVCQPGN